MLRLLELIKLVLHHLVITNSKVVRIGFDSNLECIIRLVIVLYIIDYQ